MKKIYLTASLLLLATLSFAQLNLTDTSSVASIKAQMRDIFLKKKADTPNSPNTGNTPNVDNLIPNLVPPSPSAASLGKFTDFPVNIYNGLPSVPIPIYQIKSRNITYPLTLNYHASGFKVGEVASSVGLGFSISTGLVTRTVRGLPDETSVSGFFTTRNHYPNPDNISFSGVPSSVWQEDVVETAKGKIDFEQDIYMLNAMGKLYKLIFKADGTILTIPHSDLKISVNFTNNTWEVILENGTKLSFGGNGATEVSDLTVGQSPNAEFYTFDSSWYLKSITSHQGDVVNFAYTYSAITNDISFAESDNFKVIDSYQPPFNTVIDIDPLKTTYKDQTIAVLNISSISSDNETVTFTRQATQREDMTGDYALDKITITPKNSTTATEEYQFKYHYVDAVNSIEYNPTNNPMFRKRLQLDTLARVVAGKLCQPWVFGYNPLALPSRRSYAQDHFGLYNGATSNTTLLPAIHAPFPVGIAASAGLSTVDWGFFPPKHVLGANREPDSVAMQAQILTSIQYPTGGKTVFNFEANRVPLTETVYFDNLYSLAIASSDNPFQNIRSISFPNSKPQYVKITFQGHFSSAFLEDLGDNTGLCSVGLNQQNSIPNSWGLGVKKSDLDGSNNFSYTRYVNIQALDHYTFLMNVINNGSPLNANDFAISATIELQVVNLFPPADKLVGGIRLAQTTMLDGLGNKASQRVFKYTDPFVINPINLSEYLENTQEVVCGGSNPDPTYNIKSRNSNAKFALGSIQGGTVGYGTVTTITDSLGTNGKTISVFSNEPDNGTAESKIFPYPSTNPREYKRGLLMSQTDYKADNTKVKEVFNEYEFIPKGTITGIKSGFLTYYGICGTIGGGASLCSNQYGFCGVAYSNTILSTEQVNKTKTIERIYEPSGQFYVETTMENEFGNANYTAVTKTISTEGKSDKVNINSVLKDRRSIETTFKYPYDFTTAPYASMVTKNIIAPVIEKTAKLRVLDNAGTPTYTTLSEEKTIFSTFSTNLYLPQKIETRVEGTFGTWITPVEFLGYDSRGNLTKYYQRNGQTTSLTYYGTGDYGKTDLVSSITVGGGSTGTVLARSMSYDYKPLVGLSTSSDVNAYLTKYAHDEFNRLKSVKDNSDYLLKDFRYHYYNETNPSGIGASPTATMNYVLNRTARTEQTGISLSSDVDSSVTQIQYMDGLGRGLQDIIWKATPDKSKDILSSTTLFDIFGRANKGILPTPSDVATGAYTSTALNLAKAFYDNDSIPFSEIKFEPSPLNRPQKQFGVGGAWRATGNEKFTEMSYRIAGTEVTLFDIQGSTINCGTTYPASTLYNTLAVSERGFWTIELKDRQGKVTHKFQQLQGGFIFAITAYVYDDLGRLRYVIPPEIYKKLGAGLITSFTEADEIFKEGMYGYHYDKIGRQNEKHIPGAGWTRYVYDRNDKLVLENDDKDAASSPNYYKFTKFDALNRPIYSGLINDIGTLTRSQIQTDFDNFNGQNYETIDNNGLFGYTNVSFPSGYTPAEANGRLIMRYDDYAWQTDANYNFQASNAFHAQGLAKGMMTGTIVRNLDTNEWYRHVNYYDYKGRIIQQFSQNHLRGIDRTDYEYRFNGEVLKMRITHKRTGFADIVEVYEYSYDHVGRKVSFKHTLNGVTKNISRYNHDEIGRLKQKELSPNSAIGSNQTGFWTNSSTWQGSNIPSISDQVTINQGHTVTIPNGQTVSAGTLFDKGILQNFGTLNLGNLAPSTATGTLQTIDFSYHIRGGLRGINLDANNNPSLAGGKLFSFKLGYEEGANGYFDGNIASQTWLSAVDNLSRTYTYSYDGANRILGASFSGGKPNENYSLENMSYDFNSNILSLSRNGKTGANSWGYIDQLSYAYESNSNKIKAVSDLQGLNNQDVGDFRDSSNVAVEYEYWQDGSLKIDRNKKISNIDYNYLKLPQQVTFEGGQWIKNQYDATGKKLKSTTSDGIIYDFIENKIYKNDVLYQISHDEGRIVNNSYEYNIKDHLGNLRVSFRDSSGIVKIVTKLDYDPWGLTLKGLDYSNPIFNKNNFQFGSKEKVETFGLNWIDFGARQYMPDVPHFTTIDPHVEKYESISPFSYCFNNPIKFLDIKGNDPGDVVILFSGANLNPFDKKPYGITTQIMNGLLKNANGAKVEKFLSNYAEANETGSPEFPITVEMNFDKLTQEAYDYIKANLEKDGRVAIYGYSWGGVLATYLAKRLKKDNIDVGNLILIDAADGPFSSKVDRNISDNVDEFTNIYQENRSLIASRGYPATKESSKTKGTNVRVSYVRDKNGKFVKASHTNVDEDSLEGVVNNLINFLNSQSDGNSKK